MSRRPISTPSTFANPSEDICPVCKSNRYLNPNLTFLINSECYHTMCTSCVDRLFTSGPAPCPVAGCHKTLRKKGFHKAFFGDLTIEREVDVRKRVGKVFNRRQDEFEGLLEWNNYLEMVEDLVFRIVEGSPKEKLEAESALRDYAESYKQDIERNLQAEKEDDEELKREQSAEADALRRRRIAAVREQQEEKLEIEKSKADVINRLATIEGNAERIARQGQREVTQKAEKRRGDAANLAAQNDAGLSIRGLRKKAPAEAEKPYDPFGGLNVPPSRFSLQDGYSNDWLEGAKNDVGHSAGGYSLKEYYARTMFEAFWGLEVFVSKEVAERTGVQNAASMVTAGDHNG